ncbi:MAG: hypothetical protein QG599_2349 [Pseudomonadota bacterium]|nr:hypothetical protein [Pseudomonadota bacterium]
MIFQVAFVENIMLLINKAPMLFFLIPILQRYLGIQKQ